MEQIFLIDSRVIIWVQEHLRSPGLTCVMRFITHLGDWGAVWILLAAALLIFVKTRRSGICLAVSLAAVLILNNLVLKNVFDRARPFDAISAVLPLIERPHDPSFPSGHAAAAAAAAAALFVSKAPLPLSVTSAVLAVGVAFSRLYLGVHYPSDILFGALFGAVVGGVCSALVMNMFKLLKKRRHKIDT